MNGVKIAGLLQHTIKSTRCSNNNIFTDRFIGDNDTGIYYLSGTNLIHYTWASLSNSILSEDSILQKDVIDFDLTSNSYISITTRNTLTKDGIDISDIKSQICYKHLTTVAVVGSHSVCAATVSTTYQSY